MTAGQILALARWAGVAPGVSVLDLCCGVAGPGRLITRELGCRYLGVDASRDAVALARVRAGALDCRFAVCSIPPLPRGRFDVVLLLETLLAFPDKQPLLHAVAAALERGGRFAFTLEEGEPLTEPERASMPGADTVWLSRLDELHECLERAGLRVRRQEETTQAHRAVVDSLSDAFVADAEQIAAVIGDQALADLLTAHRLWSEWFRHGRARKFLLVAEKAPGPVRTGRCG